MTVFSPYVILCGSWKTRFWTMRLMENPIISLFHYVTLYHIMSHYVKWEAVRTCTWANPALYSTPKSVIIFLYPFRTRRSGSEWIQIVYTGFRILIVLSLKASQQLYMICRSKGQPPLACCQIAQKYHAFIHERGRAETQNGHSVVKFLCIIFHFWK